VTFLSGWRLLLLIIPLIALAAYIVAQRMRPKYVARFTDVDLLSSVVPRRAGWYRHIASGLLLIALATLIVGFARPAMETRTPRNRATVMLTLDTSASMESTDVSPTRLEAAKAQARAFVAKLPSGIKVGVIQFATTASVVAAPTTDRSATLSAIDSLQEGQGTATSDAINLALQAIKSLPTAANGKPAPAVIVLLSDGTPTVTSSGGDPVAAAESSAQAAGAAKVPVDTIAFGTAEGTVTIQGQLVSVPSDPQTMAQLAKLSNGKTFTATNQNQLQSVYKSIGKAVGYDVHKNDVSGWFLGIGILLLTATAAAGLIWMQRLV
jgi:Ca-activated chloride channel family protein